MYINFIANFLYRHIWTILYVSREKKWRCQLKTRSKSSLFSLSRTVYNREDKEGRIAPSEPSSRTRFQSFFQKELQRRLVLQPFCFCSFATIPGIDHSSTPSLVISVMICVICQLLVMTATISGRPSK